MPSLFVIQGQDQGQRFDLEHAVIGLGRGQENQIQLHDTEVSRRHAELNLVETDQSYVVSDLASSNGTFVNNQRIQRQPLRSGDRVLMGRTLMIYTGREDASLGQLAKTVDIVPARDMEESRIVRALGSDAEDLHEPDRSDNQWLSRARSNLQVMYRTALAVSHTLDIDQLLRKVLELIFEWVEADRGCIMLFDRGTGELVPRVRQNRPGIRTDDKMSISRTILDYVTQNKEGVLSSDARDDDRWDAGGSIVRMGVREAICVPMQGRYDTVGIIYLDTYTSPGQRVLSPVTTKFHDDHLKLMIAIGHQAALAVEDTDYYGAMVQAERLAAIGQTIAGLSHHIKNILQGVRGGSYLIEEGLRLDQPDTVRKGWSIVDRNQEKISRLVLDMLTFSKDRVPETQPADLNAVAQEVVELMQSRAKEREVELSCTPCPDLPMLTFDAEGIHHAILNVVTNAIDACEDRQPARVAVKVLQDVPRGLVQVVVEDTGLGIAEEVLPGIFQLFHSSKGRRGTGLGLSVSQKILKEHNGEIRVQSRAGVGSTFTLEFSALTPDTVSPPVPGEAPAVTQG